MTYTALQALTVAMYNAGIRTDVSGADLPFDKAEKVLRNLKSMGWLLDGYLHEQKVPPR